MQCEPSRFCKSSYRCSSYFTFLNIYKMTLNIKNILNHNWYVKHEKVTPYLVLLQELTSLMSEFISSCDLIYISVY